MDLIRAGCCIELYEDQPPPHLWVVLSDPSGKPPEVLTVMLTTLRKTSDETLVLKVGDHPFIRHDTSVSYTTAKFRRVGAIIAAMGQRRCALKETMSRELLERLQNGLLQSPHTVHAIRAKFLGLGGDRNRQRPAGN